MAKEINIEEDAKDFEQQERLAKIFGEDLVNDYIKAYDITASEATYRIKVMMRNAIGYERYGISSYPKEESKRF